MYRETVRKFFQDEVVPHQINGRKWVRSPEIFAHAGEMNAATDAGGVFEGVDILYSAIVWSKLTRDVRVQDLHFILISCVLIKLRFRGTEVVSSKLCSGEHIGALAMTEPSAGSDFANIKTVMKKMRLHHQRIESVYYERMALRRRHLVCQNRYDQGCTRNLSVRD